MPFCDDELCQCKCYGTHEDNEAPLATQNSLHYLDPPVVVVLYNFCLYSHTLCKE